MKNLKLISYKKNLIFYISILFIFSISINQYYGNLGLCPIDSFWFFNSGYDTLNGFYPFKDYWTIAGPFITFIQALFFKVFGVSWFSYVFHASIFNFFISIFTFYTFYKFKLDIKYCFLYALLVAVIAYPSSGTPYVDHHASIMSIISLLMFILAIKTNSKIYWFFIPITLFLSFLTKQTPTGNIFLIIIFLSFIYFIFNFQIKKILLGLMGSTFIVTLFLIVLFITQIPFENFYEQYISYPLSMGKVRVEHFLFPLEFSRIILRFKLIHIPLLFMIFISIKEIKNDFKYLKSANFLIVLALIASSFALIAHQLMTINGMFIFFIIPILIGFAHIFFVDHFKKENNFLYVFIIFGICTTLYYGYKYINKRDFMDLKNANLSQHIDAKIIDKKLSGLNWISCYYPNNPKKEISNLIEAINLIKKDSRKKSIVTEYQFISVILSSYDYAPTQVWFINHVVNQSKNSKFFRSYKKLLTKQIKENKIEIVYLIKPFWETDKIYEKGLNKDCYNKVKISEILDVYTLKDCNDLNR